jgi:hypothetical protein
MKTHIVQLLNKNRSRDRLIVIDKSTYAEEFDDDDGLFIFLNTKSNKKERTRKTKQKGLYYQ